MFEKIKAKRAERLARLQAAAKIKHACQRVLVCTDELERRARVERLFQIIGQVVSMLDSSLLPILGEIRVVAKVIPETALIELILRVTDKPLLGARIRRLERLVGQQ